MWTLVEYQNLNLFVLSFHYSSSALWHTLSYHEWPMKLINYKAALVVMLIYHYVKSKDLLEIKIYGGIFFLERNSHGFLLPAYYFIFFLYEEVEHLLLKLGYSSCLAPCFISQGIHKTICLTALKFYMITSVNELLDFLLYDKEGLQIYQSWTLCKID